MSFVPDKPFEANEKVTVTTDRNVVNATSGDFAINIGDETTRKARPVEFPTSAAAPCRSTRRAPTWSRRR